MCSRRVYPSTLTVSRLYRCGARKVSTRITPRPPTAPTPIRPTGNPERFGHRPVHVRAVPLGLGLHHLRLAGPEQTQAIDGVTAGVHGRPARQVVGIPDVD